MAEATSVATGRGRSVLALARAFVTAARTWSLYPPEHPAVRSAVERFAAALENTGRTGATGFAVTPDSLLVDGVAQTDANGAIAEAAAWLHHRDVLHIAFDRNVPTEALETLLQLFAQDRDAIRSAGGPATLWNEKGHPAIRIEQLDLEQVLEEPETDTSPSRRDDLWRSIVRAVLDRRRGLDAPMQERMLEIAGDVPAIGALAEDVMAPNCAADGSPMLTSQAAAVIAAYRHLLGIIDVMSPDRREEVLRNLAAATASLDPRVVMQMFSIPDTMPGREQEANAEADVRRVVAGALDDEEVAQLLATTLALDGRASDRLASVFGTIAPDDDRQQRVLKMTREALRDTAFGRRANFEGLWMAMEELLLSYSEKPFVEAAYRQALDDVEARAARMASDVPDELAGLIATLDQENVRKLSVTLLLDLLNLEKDPAKQAALARDLGAACEDLLLAGDYASAARIAGALGARAANTSDATSTAAREALDELATTKAFCEAGDDLATMEDDAATTFADMCASVGPASIDPILHLLDAEAETIGRTRATAIVRRHGERAVPRIAPLAQSSNWYARRNAAELLGELACREAVPLLHPLLRGGDPRVTRPAVRALSSINDPAAARCVHTVLRAATGSARQAVVDALVEERDPRVVPLLGRILDESDPLGEDHALIVQTLGAVGTVGGDGAIPSVERTMRKRRWFAGRKARAIADASVHALRQIGTPAAREAIVRARQGDRVLRRAAEGAA